MEKGGRGTERFKDFKDLSADEIGTTSDPADPTFGSRYTVNEEPKDVYGPFSCLPTVSGQVRIGLSCALPCFPAGCRRTPCPPEQRPTSSRTCCS